MTRAHFRVLEPLPGLSPVVDELFPGPAANSDQDGAGKDVDYHMSLLKGWADLNRGSQGCRTVAPSRKLRLSQSRIICQFQVPHRCRLHRDRTIVRRVDGAWEQRSLATSG